MLHDSASAVKGKQVQFRKQVGKQFQVSSKSAALIYGKQIAAMSKRLYCIMLYKTGRYLDALLCQAFKLLSANKSGYLIGNDLQLILFRLRKLIIQQVLSAKEFFQQISAVKLVRALAFFLFFLLFRLLFVLLGNFVYRLIVGHDTFHYTVSGVNAKFLLQQG